MLEVDGIALNFHWSNAVFTRSMQIAQALQMQMEVQKKLYEQIEVAYNTI